MEESGLPSHSKKSPEAPHFLAEHQHGGQLHSASREYGIPLNDWLDLSTGINPTSYPLPNVPNNVWQRLPETNDGLDQIAQAYYGSSFLLSVAGSQEAIQSLPEVLADGNNRRLEVGIIKPAYHSHQQAWSGAGYEIITLTIHELEGVIDELDVLIVVNPTNPSCEQFSVKTLNTWHQRLQKNQGTLLVDEAFMDATLDSTLKKSLITESPQPGLIVLRSVGKFFGLAGVRLGFVWAEPRILAALSKAQNDWSVSHPARWAGKIALADTDWQEQQKQILKQSSERLLSLLEASFFSTDLRKDGVNKSVNNTALFAYFEHQDATSIYQQLAKYGVLVRLFNNPSTTPALRFGLPANESEWEKLEKALINLNL